MVRLMPLNSGKYPIHNILRRVKAVLFAAVAAVVLCGCASLAARNNTLAVVDGEAITKGDLGYSLQIEHRREDLSSARELDIPGYVNKLIDLKLLVQEARRMGIENTPEVQEKVNAYLIRESVTRLYREEIVGKVSVDEKEIVDYYRKNYERFNVILITLDSEKEAEKVLDMARSGNDFRELALEYSAAPNHVERKLRRGATGFLEKILLELNPGEVSGVVSAHNRYYIVKLLERTEAPEDEFVKHREKIREQIKSEKVEKRGKEYLARLRELAEIRINRDILSSIDTEDWSERRKELLADSRPLAEVNKTVLTVRDFVAMLSVKNSGRIEMKLDNWIDMEVVNQEALSRHYEKNTELKDSLRRYKDQIVKNAFINRVIVPNIKITREEMRDYYESNQEQFLKPFRYRIQRISVKTEEEAEDILKSLREGASFSWLAKMKSVDSYARSGGNAGWLTKEELPEEARKIIPSLVPGETSPVIKLESFYGILRLQDKSTKKVREFKEVKSRIYRKLSEKEYREIYEEYIDKLRAEADIKVYDEAVQSFQEMLRN